MSPHYPSLSFCVLIQLSLASVYIWFTHWLLKLAVAHHYSSFLHHWSLTPCFPPASSICPLLCIFVFLLSCILSSLHRYSNAFIFPTLPTFIQFVFLFSNVSIFSFPVSRTPVAASASCSPFLLIIISEQCSSTAIAKRRDFIFWKHMVNYLYYTEVISICIASSVL